MESAAELPPAAEGDAAAAPPASAQSDSSLECAKALTLINATQPTKINLKEGNIEIMLNVLDGDVLKDLVRTLLATVKAQAETIDSINARCAAIEKLNPEEIVTRVTDLENGLTNIAQNIQGFAEEADPDTTGYGAADEAVEEEYDPMAKAAELEEKRRAEEIEEQARVAKEKREFEEAEAKREEEERVAEEERKAAAEEEDRKAREAAEAAAVEAAAAAAEAAKQMAEEAAAAAKAEAEAASEAEKAKIAAEAAAKQAELEAKQAELAEAAAKQEEDRKKLEAELARMREAEEQRIAEQHAEEKKKRLGSNFGKIRKSAKLIGSAKTVATSKDLSGARRTWRKAIRLVITNNRQQANMVGVLKSRAMKGMSVGERLKRCEDRLYKELRELNDKLNKSLDGESEREAAVARLEEAIAEMREQLRALPETLSDVFAPKKETQEAIDDLTSRLGAMASTLAEIKAAADAPERFAALEKEHAALAERLSGYMNAAKKMQEQQLTKRVQSYFDGIVGLQEPAADIKKQLEETLDTRTLDAQNPLTRKPVAFFQDDTELRGKRRKLEGMEGLAGVYGTGLSDVSVTLACYADAGEAMPALADTVQKLLKRTETEHARLTETLNGGTASAGGFDELLRQVWADFAVPQGGGGSGAPSQEMIDFLARLEKELALKASTEDLGAVQQKVDQTGAELSNNVVLTGQLAGSVDKLDGATESLDQRVKELEKVTLAEIDKRIGAQVQALTDTFFARLELAESGVKENATAMTEVRAQLQEQAASLQQLYINKADKKALQAGLDLKADKSELAELLQKDALRDLEELLRQLRANFDALKDKQAADTARMMEQMKKLLAEMLAKSDGLGKKGGSAGTTLACLLCGDQVPEVSVCDFATGHRQLLPKLGQSVSGANSIVNAQFREDVYRAGFRMPANRPGTTPGMALHSPASGGGGAPGDQYSSSSPAAGGGPQVRQHYGDAGAVDASSMPSAGIGKRFPSSKGYRANDLLRARTASPQKAGGRAALSVTGKGSKADRLLNQAASMSQNQLQSMAPSQPALPEE